MIIFILYQKSAKCADILQSIHLGMTRIIQTLARIKLTVVKVSVNCAFLIRIMCGWHSVDQSFIKQDQETIASNDSMSATTENAAQKSDNSDTESGVNEATITALPSSAPHSNPNNTVQVKELEWKIRKITGKKHTSLKWEYKVVWAKSWISWKKLRNAQRLLQNFKIKFKHNRFSCVSMKGVK